MTEDPLNPHELYHAYGKNAKSAENRIDTACKLAYLYFRDAGAEYDTAQLAARLREICAPESGVRTDSGIYHIFEVLEGARQTRFALLLKVHSYKRKYPGAEVLSVTAKPGDKVYDYIDKGHYIFSDYGRGTLFFDFDPREIDNIYACFPYEHADPYRIGYHTKDSVAKLSRDIKERETRENREHKKKSRIEARKEAKIQKRETARFRTKRRRNSVMISDGKDSFVVRCSSSKHAFKKTAADIIRHDIYNLSEKRRVALYDLYKEATDGITITYRLEPNEVVRYTVSYGGKRIVIEKRQLKDQYQTRNLFKVNGMATSRHRTDDIIRRLPSVDPEELKRKCVNDPVSVNREYLQNGLDIKYNDTAVKLPVGYEKGKGAYLAFSGREIPIKRSFAGVEKLRAHRGSWGGYNKEAIRCVFCETLKNVTDIVFLIDFIEKKAEEINARARKLLEEMKLTETEWKIDDTTYAGYVVHGRMGAYFVDKENAKVWTYPSGKYICIQESRPEYPICTIDKVVNRILALQNDTTTMKEITTLASAIGAEA